MRFSDYFDLTARKYSQSPALIFDDQVLDFCAVNKYVHRAGNALVHDPRIRSGAHIAIFSHNDYRVPILNLAISRADMVSIPTYVNNAIDSTVAALDFMDCEIIFFHSDFHSEVAQLKERLDRVVLCLCIDKDSPLGPFLDDWLAEFDQPYEPGMEDPDAMLWIRPTGGTTGPSKGVVHPNRAGELALINALDTEEMVPGARYLAVAPMSHAGGVFAMFTMIAGGAVVVCNTTKPDAILAAMEKYRITSLFVPPTLLYGMMAAQGAGQTDLGSLKVIRTGAAPISPAKYREAVNIFGPVIYESYGQSECSICLTNKRPSDYLREDGGFDESVLASMGKAGKYVRMEVMDPEGNILPDGEVGELVIQSGMVMQGYYKNPEETNAAIKEGWLHTGDVVRRDERGYFTMVDRLKEMIISGGFNVYPAQIEAVIQGDASVLDCAVVGMPDEKWGEAVTAVVQLKNGSQCTADGLMQLCREALGPVYTPKAIYFRGDLPRSAAGKVLRRQIRDELLADKGR